MMKALSAAYRRWIDALDGQPGRRVIVSIATIIVVAITLALSAYLFRNTAAPRHLTISAGPEGSSFRRNAERYQKILAREGLSLKILESDGSAENLTRLADPKEKVDLGFVLSGEAGEKRHEDLRSLGAVAYQPLMVFYTGKPAALLSDFKGRRINIGPEGSGTHDLGLALLKANGIEPGGATTIDKTDLDDPARALHDKAFDVVFVMGESTATKVTRALMRDDTVRLFGFAQADAYARRMNHLQKLELPRGALDFGRDLPREDIHLIAPTVQLVARESLHPALSDLVLEAAREVHGRAGLYRKRGEFPRAIDGEFRTSDDATRYYASGKSFLYRTFPFWLASMIVPVVAVLVPIVLFLIPALRIVPTIYRWRMQSRIYRWYRDLLAVERDAARGDAAARAALVKRLDEIEASVNRIAVPAAFGDLFYGLRGHIGFVRQNLLGIRPAAPAPATEA
jgi:hypothetical protein